MIDNLITCNKGDEKMSQDLKALMGMSREDLRIRAEVINPVKRINYKAIADMIINDLKDVLSCYDSKYRLTVALNYLKIYGKGLSDSYKGYILVNSEVL